MNAYGDKHKSIFTAKVLCQSLVLQRFESFYFAFNLIRFSYTQKVNLSPLCTTPWRWICEMEIKRHTFLISHCTGRSIERYDSVTLHTIHTGYNARRVEGLVWTVAPKVPGRTKHSFKIPIILAHKWTDWQGFHIIQKTSSLCAETLILCVLMWCASFIKLLPVQ